MKKSFKNHANRLVMALATATIFSCSSGEEDWLPPPSEGKGNDIANYRTVKIGNQTWMAENLDYDVNGSKCYNNDPANCAKYGRLYNWATAKTVCPSGWRLPSASEWDILMNYVQTNNGSTYDGDYNEASIAGKYLKATRGWDYNGNGEDKYNFTALPGGFSLYHGDDYGDNFTGIGVYGEWWSSSTDEDYSENAYYISMYYSYDRVEWFGNSKSYLRSVRCVQSGDNYYGGNSSSSRNNVSDIPRSSSSSNITNSEPYCYGYGNYRDCNLIGGRWIPDVQYCLSGGGNIVNADYCYRNGITIDDTPSNNSSSSSSNGTVLVACKWDQISLPSIGPIGSACAEVNVPSTDVAEEKASCIEDDDVLGIGVVVDKCPSGDNLRCKYIMATTYYYGVLGELIGECPIYD